jgi:hypothetical protein
MNKALAKIFQILGYKHLGIILTFPNVMFVDKAIRRLFDYILLAEGFDRERKISFCKAYYNIPQNYILGTEILVPFSYIDREHGQKVDASDLVFSKPKLAEEYEEYARQRKDELLRELEEDIQELIGGNGNVNGDDSVAKFIAECLEERVDGVIAKRELYRHYLQFCKRNGLIPLTMIEFGRRLKAKMMVEEWRDYKKHYWKGITYKSTCDCSKAETSYD